MCQIDFLTNIKQQFVKSNILEEGFVYHPQPDCVTGPPLRLVALPLRFS